MVLSLVVTCVWCVGGALVAGDWNTGAGGRSSRDCLSSEFGPDAPELLWDESLPAIVAQQAVTEGNVAIMARIGSFTIPTGTWVVAHDLTTGEILWEIQLPFDFPDSWRSRVSAVNDGRVFATRAGNTNEDYLYALDIADGGILWQSDDLVDEGTTESLAFASNGDIVAGNFSSLLRIDATDGSTVWETSRSCPTSSGCQVAVFGERAYVWEASPQGPVISAFDLDSGSFLYSSAPVGGGFIQQVGPFVGPDGTVYAPRSVNNPGLDFLRALEDTGTGFTIKWNQPIGYVPFATFGIGPDGSVYSYTTTTGPDEITVHRLDPDTGNVIDSTTPLPANFPAQPRMAIDAAGRVFFTNGGFTNGAVYSFNADLSLRWTEAVTNVNVGGPALGENGTLIICGVGTDVRAYRTAGPPPAPEFERGDCANDGGIGLTDAISGLGFLFQGTGPAACEDACDHDDDGNFGLPDMIQLLNFLFGTGPEPAAPYPGCGVDPTMDSLECPGSSGCP